MQTPRTDKMRTTPVGKLLLSLSLPVMVSMTFQALYNTVDSIFVAWYSEAALSAIALTYPMQSLMIAVGIGTCIGLNAFLGRTLGQRNHEKARAIVQHGALLMFLSYAIFLVLGLFFTEQFFVFQTTDADIITYGIEYMTPCLVFSLFLFGQQLFEKLLQASGRAVLSMVPQIIGAVVNILLDPLLIFGLFSFPALGVKGAAFATILGQLTAFVIAAILNQHFNKVVKLTTVKFKFDVSLIKQIYSVGLPAIALQAIGSIANFLLNGILLTFSSTAAAFYGAYVRLQGFLFMPIFGLAAGMLPIVSYNLGAKETKRVTLTLRFAMLYSGIIMVIGTLVFQLFPHELLSLYDASEDLYAMGIPALHIISVYFIFEGFCLTSQAGFQALGQGLLSFISSLIRQIVVLIPVAFALSLTGDLQAVWFAFPIMGIIGSLVCVFLWKRRVRC